MTVTALDRSRAAWKKAKASTNNGGGCVEVAMLAPVIGMRDSKLPTEGDYPILEIPTMEWRGLLRAVRTEELSG